MIVNKDNIDKFSEEIHGKRLPPKRRSRRTNRFVKQNKNNLSANIVHFSSSTKQIDTENNRAEKEYEQKYLLVLKDYDSLVESGSITKKNVATGRAGVTVVKLVRTMLDQIDENDYSNKPYAIDLEEYGRLSGQILDSDSKEKVINTKKNIRKQALKDKNILLNLKLERKIKENAIEGEPLGEEGINIFSSVAVDNDYFLKYKFTDEAMEQLRESKGLQVHDNQVFLSGQSTLFCQLILFLEPILTNIERTKNKRVEIPIKDIYEYLKDLTVSYDDLPKGEKHRWKIRIQEPISKALLDIQEQKGFSFDFEPIEELTECKTWQEFLNEKLIVTSWQIEDI